VNYQQLIKHIQVQLPDDGPVYVGYSGGLDSSLLLRAVCDAVLNQQVIAIHCNHGVNPEAGQWQQFCEQQATSLNAQLVVEKLDFPQGFSETAGREARYEVFASHLKEGSVLFLGHHADDQAETVLFRLFRGTGLRGLTGIPQTRKFASGTIVRPLMSLSRSEIEAMAREAKVEWVNDASNQDDAYDRNYIRHNLLPIIIKRWPNLIHSIGKLSDHLEDEVKLLDDYADELLNHLDVKNNGQIDVIASLDLTALSRLQARQQSLALKRFLSIHLDVLPESLNLSEILAQFLSSSADAEPLYELGDQELRRFNQRIYLLEAQKPGNTEQDRPWDGRAPLVVANGILRLLEGPPENFVVRFRSGGERLKPEGRNHSQTLKKLMQEYQIEPWLRHQIPLIYQGDKIIAVGDRIHCTEHRFEWVRK
jgi:tRNA(Ile)-lysidine synthase